MNCICAGCDLDSGVELKTGSVAAIQDKCKMTVLTGEGGAVCRFLCPACFSDAQILATKLMNLLKTSHMNIYTLIDKTDRISTDWDTYYPQVKPFNGGFACDT